MFQLAHIFQLTYDFVFIVVAIARLNVFSKSIVFAKSLTLVARERMNERLVCFFFYLGTVGCIAVDNFHRDQMTKSMTSLR